MHSLKKEKKNPSKAYLRLLESKFQFWDIKTVKKKKKKRTRILNQNSESSLWCRLKKKRFIL